MQVPDSVRPTLDLVAKHHFWMLAVIVPVALLPCLFAAQSGLVEKISQKQAEIDGRLSSLQGVQKSQPHPAEAWVTAIKGSTDTIRRETLLEWESRWDRQSQLFQWPKALGDDFIRQASRLKSDGSLSRALLERYQNGIRAVVRKIPDRMGAEERMLDTAGRGGMGSDPGAGFGGVGGPEGSGPGFGGAPGLGFGGPAAPAMGAGQPGARTAAEKQRAVEWNAADQAKLYQSFDWKRPPSTAQVVVAQEELWLYELLCECVSRVNAGAGGQYNSSIPYVHELAVGYPAAEDRPWGEGEARIVRPSASAGPGDAMMSGMGSMGGMGGMGGMGPGAEGGGAGRPPNPRFAGLGQRAGGGGMMGSMDPAGGAAVEDDDSALLNWAYVGIDGKPLAADEIDSAPEAKLMRFVPFRLKVQMDQRRIEALLGILATAALPIDVRQVRVNPGLASRAGRQGGDGMEVGSAMGGDPMGAQPQRATGGRVFDAIVEIRGSIAVVRPPDPAVLGIEADATASSRSSAMVGGWLGHIAAKQGENERPDGLRHEGDRVGRRPGAPARRSLEKALREMST